MKAKNRLGLIPAVPLITKLQLFIEIISITDQAPVTIFYGSNLRQTYSTFVVTYKFTLKTVL